MRELEDEIEDQDKPVRDVVERAVHKVQKSADRGTARGALAATSGLVIAAVAAGIGLVLYRRRRRSLTQRLQDAVGDSLRDVPDEIRSQLKRPLARVVRAL